MTDHANAILLPVDSSGACDAAVEYVAQLAHDQHRPVVVLHVHEVAAHGWGETRTCCPDGAESPTVAVADRLAQRGIAARQFTATTMHDAACVANEIRRAGQQCGAGLIVVCPRGRSDVASLALGSVTHRLLHRADIPVLVIPRAHSTAVA